MIVPPSVGAGRILLRALSPLDIDVLHAAYSDDSLWWEQGAEPPPPTFLTVEYLQALIYQRRMGLVNEVFWVICLQEHGVGAAPIGQCSLTDYNARSHGMEVGLEIFARGFRGQGLGGEILGCLCRIGFEGLGLRALTAQIHEENRPSLRLFERFGFCRVGRRWQAARIRNRYVNMLDYRRLADGSGSGHSSSGMPALPAQ